MPLTPETLPRHELTGLPVRVVESDDPGRVGIEGRVVLETTNTLRIECVPLEAEPGGDEPADSRDGETRVVTVPKAGTTFEFAITDDAAGDRKAPGTASKLADTQPESDDGSSDSDRAGGDAASCRGDGPDGDRPRAAGEGVAYVTVDGSRLQERPARRTETAGDSPWQ
ncbi:ribonuclease P protein component 1 [Halovivax limisalsi]|uniref:ribonuclease P protein component 1 n=1 Tax=Halovivax limisalsi TaxID=1453760 RepID=UPI001FFD974A|nr:ribonuclease P protein component 1 [Halovivax limisalsi]